jgi:ADP-heptose:LPS heptosyltransferase
LTEWKGIADGLRRKGLRLLWIASPSEREELAAFGGEIAADLSQATAAMAAAVLFIGHDSGPLHVANALGTPAVGLYLPGQPKRTFPQGSGRFVLIERPGPEGLRADDVLSAAAPLLK